MSIDVQQSETALDEARNAFIETILEKVVGSLEIASIYVGVQLGYFAALAEHGPMTIGQLAARTGTNERYAQEWLQQQATAGVLETEPATRMLPELEQRFLVPDAHREALYRPDATGMMGEMSAIVAAVFACALQAPAVVEVFRNGAGLPLSQYGEACIHGMDALSHAGDAGAFANEWIPLMPDIHERLRSDPPARVAEIGSGGGQMAIALARQYPSIRVDGIDIDPDSVALARQNAERAGVADRVHFHCRDAAEVDDLGPYDLVVSFACIHDLTNPVAVLGAAHRMLDAGGSVFIQDPLVEPFSGVPGTRPERLAYSASVLHCLPVGMNASPAAGTGTAMQAETMRSYALSAGFSDVQIVDAIEQEGFLGFYRLIP